MVESKKAYGFVDVIKEISQSMLKSISTAVSPHVVKGITNMKNSVDEKIIQIEQRILKRVSLLLTRLFGGILLIFALFFFLINSLHWNKATALFFIGISILLISFLLDRTIPGK